MIFFSSLQSILSIVIMISVGYYLTYKGFLDEKASSLFSKLVVNLALPCLMISDLLGSFSKDKLMNSSNGLAIPFIVIAITYLIAIIVSNAIKVKEGTIGIFRSMFFVSNSIFIGLPVNLALFGSSSVPFVLLYYIANTTFFWTLGVYGISKDGKSSARSIFSIETLKRIVSPPLLGFIFALILIMLDLQLPKFLLDTCKYFGGLTTPLSMIFIGITLHSVKLREIEITKDMIVLLLGRFLIAPFIMLLFVKTSPLPVLMKQVFIIQSAMPVMTNTAIVAKKYDADYKYATVMTVITTLLSIILIPIYMSLMQYVK